MELGSKMKQPPAVSISRDKSNDFKPTAPGATCRLQSPKTFAVGCRASCFGQGAERHIRIARRSCEIPLVGLHKDDGHFIVSAELKNAAIDYVPSMKVLDDGNFERAAHWPLLTDIQGRLIFEERVNDGAGRCRQNTRRDGFKNPRPTFQT